MRPAFVFASTKRNCRGPQTSCLPHSVFIRPGCFWHGHDCHLFKWPATREEWWRKKINRNVANDTAVKGKLLESGWRVAEVWECALKGKSRLDGREAMRSLATWIRSESDRIVIRGKKDWSPTLAQLIGLMQEHRCPSFSQSCSLKTTLQKIKSTLARLRRAQRHPHGEVYVDTEVKAGRKTRQAESTGQLLLGDDDGRHLAPGADLISILTIRNPDWGLLRGCRAAPSSLSTCDTTAASCLRRHADRRVLGYVVPDRPSDWKRGKSGSVGGSRGLPRAAVGQGAGPEITLLQRT